MCTKARGKDLLKSVRSVWLLSSAPGTTVQRFSRGAGLVCQSRGRWPSVRFPRGNSFSYRSKVATTHWGAPTPQHAPRVVFHSTLLQKHPRIRRDESRMAATHENGRRNRLPHARRWQAEGPAPRSYFAAPTGVATGVSQPNRSFVRPSTMAKNSFCIFSVIGPRFPSPI
jgi:hypothetical protein